MGYALSREFFVSLERGDYISRPVPTDVEALLVSIFSSVNGIVEADCVPCCEVDALVLRIIVDEAVSNARRYRQPGSTVKCKGAAHSSPYAPSHTARLPRPHAPPAFRATHHVHLVSQLSFSGYRKQGHLCMCMRMCRPAHVRVRARMCMPCMCMRMCVCAHAHAHV